MLVSIHTKLYGGMHYINTISRFFRYKNPKLHTQMRRWLQIMTREWEKVRSQGLPRSTLHRNLQLTFQGRKTSCEVFRNVCTIHYCLTFQHPLEEFVPFISKEYISHQCDSTGVFPKRFSKGKTPKQFFHIRRNPHLWKRLRDRRSWQRGVFLSPPVWHCAAIRSEHKT